MTTEFRDIVGADVRYQLIWPRSEVQLRDGKPELKIGGLIFHSAIVAEHIRVVQEGSTARILIDMALTHPGKSSRFEVTVPLSDNVEHVVFGSAGNELWRDESGGRGPCALRAPCGSICR